MLDVNAYTHRISPNEAVIANFMDHNRAYLPRTCWADSCAK